MSLSGYSGNTFLITEQPNCHEDILTVRYSFCFMDTTCTIKKSYYCFKSIIFIFFKLEKLFSRYSGRCRY